MSAPPPDLGPHDAVIAVDVQNDFCPGGALPVPGGDQIVPVLNRWIAAAAAAGAMVVASRDWHPPDHCSFLGAGGRWPVHCVQGTPGAALHKDLALPAGALLISKADRPDRDAYSAFQGTALASALRGRGVRRLWIGGLALDYCVRATVLDAVAAGFEVHLLRDATRAVDLRRGDGGRALAEMKNAGAFVEEAPA
jgi:nicotinamidase/pyrazinamidase